MKITLNRKKIYLEVFLQHINKICLRLFYVCCVVVVVVAVSVTIMFTLWSCLFYHTWSCHLLLWYLVVLGIVSIFVVVIVSFHFILWCIVVVGQYQFSLLGLVHEGVEGVVKGVHEVGVVDWRLSAWEIDI